ncbi:MAG: hypothetical protein LW853_06405 [Rickettsiales bacterium]|nr:hypothetical protein [Rickettsiales bacterium]
MSTNNQTPYQLFMKLKEANGVFSRRLKDLPNPVGPGSGQLNRMKDRLTAPSCPIQIHCSTFLAFEEQLAALFVKAARTGLYGGLKAYNLRQEIDSTIRDFLVQAEAIPLSLQFEAPGHPRSDLTNPELAMTALGKWCEEITKERQELESSQASNKRVKKASPKVQESQLKEKPEVLKESVKANDKPKTEIITQSAEAAKELSGRLNKKQKKQHSLSGDKDRSVHVTQPLQASIVSPVQAVLMGWRLDKKGNPIDPRNQKKTPPASNQNNNRSR